MAIEVGDEAPDFALPDGKGGTVRLSEYRGKQPVVVAFYPMAFTGGWTTEFSGFAELQDEFLAAGAQVLGISIDTPASASHFAEHLALKFPLLGDWPRYEVGRTYGVFNDDRAIHIRATYVVDREGTVRAALIEREGGKHPPFALEAVRGLAGTAPES